MLRHVDLCSGIGGFALGLEWAGLSKPIMFCDNEKWCRQILAKHWPDVEIKNDVKELADDPKRLVPDCDILTAGYPCQPFSVAGKQKGDQDDRHLWPYLLKIVKQKRPTWCVFENVVGHVALGLDKVLLDLETAGYASRPLVIPAGGVDARHRRYRVWIVAHTNGEQRERSGKESVYGQRNVSIESRRGGAYLPHGWEPEPGLGRVATGVPRRVDRIKGLGNSVVPQIAEKIGLAIKAQENIDD